MRKLVSYFFNLNCWIKLIFFFCVLGMLTNAYFVYRDIALGGVLLRLHAGFFLLYGAQVVFILLGERMVWILAVLQGFLALFVNADFTFMPLTRLLGRIVYSLGPVALDNMREYRYVVVALAFTLQMLSAFALFSLLPKHNVSGQEKNAPIGE